jgi:hypothetical protein
VLPELWQFSNRSLTIRSDASVWSRFFLCIRLGAFRMAALFLRQIWRARNFRRHSFSESRQIRQIRTATASSSRTGNFWLQLLRNWPDWMDNGTGIHLLVWTSDGRTRVYCSRVGVVRRHRTDGPWIGLDWIGLSTGDWFELDRLDSKLNLRLVYRTPIPIHLPTVRRKQCSNR